MIAAPTTTAYAQFLGYTRRKLFEPLDISMLVYIRIAFGAIMLWEVWRYFTLGRIERYYIEPAFNFPYQGFEFIQPWPGDGMIWHFYLMGLLAILIMVGLFYRLSASLFFLAFSYVFLLDQANYLNHFYMVSLFSFIMIFIPAHRAFSLDAHIWPRLRADTAPAWTLYWVRAQIGIVYVFGAIAKLNGDWLQAEPIRMWIAERSAYPVLGPYLTEPWAGYFFAYGGLGYDLLIVPLILWRVTRWPALAFSLFFHLSNAYLFNIGIFPWFMLAITLIYFPPHWPRIALGTVLPALKQATSAETADTPHRQQNLIMAGLAIYLAVQFYLPLRHFFIPGDVNWTEEGHNLAWHMKLRDKQGEARFFVTDPHQDEVWEVDVDTFIDSRQASAMDGRPNMIVSFAHYLDNALQTMGYDDLEIRAWAMISLNGRPRQLMIDPSVDLTTIAPSFAHKPWILPLRQPLTLSNQPPTLPHPALLVRKRDDGSLLMVNMTERAFQLDELRLGAGDGALADWGIDLLDVAQCLIIQPDDGVQRELNAACNLAAPALTVSSDAAIWAASYPAYLNEQLVERCDGERCVISPPVS